VTSPAHHRQGGGYRNPWPGGEPRGFREFLRWRRARFRTVLPTAPEGSMPVAQPANAQPRTTHGEIRITWVGHASFLIQTGGFNVLTDPVWSDRVSPLPWLGPKRIVRPGLPFEALPPIDAVLLSHDHYDHLDARRSVIAGG
jgi:glyoxylase-like metal-dependent hydrolase (beta-lactamase superfamily II)